MKPMRSMNDEVRTGGTERRDRKSLPPLSRTNSIVHGGDRESFLAAAGREPLDFSVNLNPLGIPAAVVSAYSTAAGEARYPDPVCRQLTAALAGHYGMAAENILCGNGASDIIYRYFYAVRPGRVLLPVPTFSEYPRAVSACGGQAVYYPLRETEAFSLTGGILKPLRGGPFQPLSSAGRALSAAESMDAMPVCADFDCLILIHPHNPTGRLIEEDLLEDILETAAAQHIRLFIDACFMELTGISFPYAEIVKNYPNVFILNAFTKTYAMAGMRLGYGMSSDTALLARMREAGPPWSVSWPAQKAGLAALKEERRLKDAVELISCERERLMKALTNLGFGVVPSEANYMMFSSKQELVKPLAAAGIMIRDLSGEIGLRKEERIARREGTLGCRTDAPAVYGDRYWYRIAVRTPEENNIILEELKKIAGRT